MFNSIGASEYANETAVPEGRQANEMSAFAEQTKKMIGPGRAPARRAAKRPQGAYSRSE